MAFTPFGTGLIFGVNDESLGFILLLVPTLIFGLYYTANTKDDNIMAGGKDDDSGLYYMNARWMDPNAGRFVYVDPLGASTARRCGSWSRARKEVRERRVHGTRLVPAAHGSELPHLGRRGSASQEHAASRRRPTASSRSFRTRCARRRTTGAAAVAAVDLSGIVPWR